MRLLKILLFIILIIMAIPLFNKAKNYLSEKSHEVKLLGEAATKAFKYKKGEDENKK